jgi:N-carbamoylputrescine amidase
VAEKVPAVVEKFSRLARENHVAIVLSSPKYNAEKDRYFNTAIFINERGQVLGEHHKINVLPGSEGWSSPGFEVRPIHWKGHNIGLLICSDAYTDNIARELAAQGADVLLSPAAWAPGMHEPNGEWEQRSEQDCVCMCVIEQEKGQDGFRWQRQRGHAGGRRLFEYLGKEPPS